MDEIGNPFRYLRACVDDAPAGTYEHAKSLRTVIGRVMDMFMSELQDIGFKTDNCDHAHACEAAMYAYVKRSNPDSTVFATAEGFGEAMDGPARERVIAQASRDRDALAKTCEQTCPHGHLGVHSAICPDTRYECPGDALEAFEAGHMS